MRRCTFSRSNFDIASNNGHSNNGETANGNGVGVGDSQKACLENVSFTVCPGELLGVIGHMGSGKSTLVSAIAGEEHRTQGSMEVNESRVILVPNTPWLKSGTIKENILFGSAYHRDEYEAVVGACGLREDFRRLPLKDQTWVHGNGDNLSGGQKQRISLARAVYKNGSLYLMDDPLSAVDPTLRHSIFKEVIGNGGLLKRKTRLVIVNEYSLVQKMDRVVLLKDRTIADIGTLEQLKRTHDLDLEVFTRVKEEEIEEVDRKVDPVTSKPRLKRQETLKTAEILKSMKSLNYDNADDLTFDSVTANNYRYYLRSLGTIGVILVLAGYFASQAFEVCSKLWLAAWTSTDQATADRTDNDFILIYGLLGISQSVTFLLAVLHMNRLSVAASAAIHRTTLSKVIYSTIDFIWSNQVGQVANRFSRDMNEVDLILPGTAKNFIYQVMRIVGTLFLVIFTFPANTLTAVPLIAAIFWVFQAYIRISRLFRRLGSATAASVNAFVTETANGVATIRTYRTQQFVVDECMREIDSHQKHMFMEMASDCWLFVRLQIFTGLFTGVLATVIVFFRHTVTSHMAGLCLTSAIMIMNDVFLFTRYAAALEKSMVSVERLQEYADVAQENLSPYDARLPLPPPSSAGSTSSSSSKDRGQIAFQRLTGRYPNRGGELCLRDVSLKIRAGEKVAVVGRTGAGKSSVAMMLFRMVEKVDGNILVDDADISRMDLARHRARITIIPQDYALFQGSLRYNLDPEYKYSDAHILEVFRASGLTDLLEKFSPSGLEMQIESDGTGLSEGEKQLICCMRAMLSNNKIVILDEATSSLTHSMETRLTSALASHFRSSTVITITHRVHKALYMDKVLVMDHGKVREFDAPNRLAENRQSMFYSMLKEAKAEQQAVLRRRMSIQANDA